LTKFEEKKKENMEKIENEEAEWTEYFTLDEPMEYGDVEYLEDMREAMGSGVCDTPIDIEVVTVENEIPAREMGEVFKTFKADKGFICLNADQVN
jgi:hypothetical protein